MQIQVLKSKIHRATLTQCNLHYSGSITIDEDLMDAANMKEYEKVLIVNVNNGERIETYVIKGKRGEGVIGLNGAAARRGEIGDLLIILSFANIDPENEEIHPIAIFPNDKNQIR